MKGVLVGQITQIGEVNVYGENGFKKQEAILKTVEEYSNYYKVEFTQGNIELTKNLEIGKTVKLTVNVRGREYTSESGDYSVFMSINVWKVESV